jgi:hypothetical protein
VYMHRRCLRECGTVETALWPDIHRLDGCTAMREVAQRLLD